MTAPDKTALLVERLRKWTGIRACQEAVTLLLEQQAEIERLRAALKPFAEYDVGPSGDELFCIHDDHPLLGSGLGDEWRPAIYTKQFRAARSAMATEVGK